MPVLQFAIRLITLFVGRSVSVAVLLGQMPQSIQNAHILQRNRSAPRSPPAPSRPRPFGNRTDNPRSLVEKLQIARFSSIFATSFSETRSQRPPNVAVAFDNSSASFQTDASCDSKRHRNQKTKAAAEEEQEEATCRCSFESLWASRRSARSTSSTFARNAFRTATFYKRKRLIWAAQEFLQPANEEQLASLFSNVPPGSQIGQPALR